MTDDLLGRATRALREETEEGDASARFTRARVMAGLQQNTTRRRVRLAFALPLAACFAAATAFGTMKGRSTELWHEVVQALGFAHTEEAPPAKPSKRLAPKSADAASKPVPESSSHPAALEPAPSASDAPALAPVETPPAVTAVSAAPKASAAAPKASAPRGANAEMAPAPAETAPAPAPEASDPAHELYRVAHQSHFVDHDFASALRAWDAYLTAAPNGRFAPEARYNRALCLVRLGRKDDAERALRAFADGAYGGYRRDEAKALIDALQH